MKCDICKKNEAVLYIEDVEGHNVTHRKFCIDCMMNMSGDAMSALLPLASMLGGLNIPGMSMMLDKHSFKCPSCNRSLEEVENTRIVGCDECYKTFSDFIDPMIFTSGYALPYKGSYPRSMQRFCDHRKRIRMLQSKLRDAVDTEDFENAARVRDELKREKEKYRQ